LQAAEVERRSRYPEPFEQARRGAFLDGFSLHAGIRIHANDGDGRERLCRYILRPPLALHRLSRSDDGTLQYRMKRPRHGSLWLSLTVEDVPGGARIVVRPKEPGDLDLLRAFARDHAERMQREAPRNTRCGTPTLRNPIPDISLNHARGLSISTRPPVSSLTLTPASDPARSARPASAPDRTGSLPQSRSLRAYPADTCRGCPR
jgi:Putative transposase